MSEARLEPRDSAGREAYVKACRDLHRSFCGLALAEQLALVMYHLREGNQGRAGDYLTIMLREQGVAAVDEHGVPLYRVKEAAQAAEEQGDEDPR